MTQTLLLIFALFSAIVMALSLYWNNLSAKFVSITLLVILANCVYFSLDGVKGWPAEEPNAVKGVLASVVIVNPSAEDAGGIYIGLFPNMPKKWYQYEYNRLAPKTYYIEYSNDRAAKFELAKKAMEEGKEVQINGIPPKDGSGEGEVSQEVTDPAEALGNILSGIMKMLIPKERDTYKPNVPDIDIVAPTVPPAKGTNQ